MHIVTVSSQGRIVVPASVRRRLGLTAGAKLALFEEPLVLRLEVLRPVLGATAQELAGMVTAPRTGRRRSLDTFDQSSSLARKRR
jgi:AbrB family looped-hinge helix DNA binding protein